jgi:hypothetical protein
MTHRVGMVGTVCRARARIEFWTEKLLIVERAMAVEMQRPIRSRRTNLLWFLYRERTVCTHVIAELSTFAQEANDTSIDESTPEELNT